MNQHSRTAARPASSQGVLALFVSLALTPFVLAQAPEPPTRGAAQEQSEERLTPELQTSWLEFVKGHREDGLGAEVREVSTDPATGQHRLIIALPKVAMGDYPELMEEVRVVGERPESQPLLPEFEYEWVEDYDNEFYGLLLRFREGQRLPFRLFFSSDAGFLQP